MIRILLLIAAVVCVPCFAVAEAPQGDLPLALQLDDAPAQSPAKGLPSELSTCCDGDCPCDGLEKRIADLEAYNQKLYGYLDRNRPVTEDRVREIVREELEAVLGVRMQSGEIQQRPVKLNESGATQVPLGESETLYSINGQRVNQSTYADGGNQVTRYTAPGYEARSYQNGSISVQPRGVFGRLFNRGGSQATQSCYVDSAGNRVCP